MKKFVLLCSVLFAAAFAANIVLPVRSTYAATQVLKVCNWEDYIDEAVCDEFEAYMAEKGQTVRVEYSTFGTNENLYNDLKIANGYLYDVVCPSDYMIEKMAKEGMLAKISLAEDGNYASYVSPYISGIFEDSITWTNGGAQESLADYAVGYMWGTMGFTYNPAFSDSIEEDMKSWLSIWDEAYSKKVTIKDSVRDSYFVGIAYACRDELKELKDQYAAGGIDREAYNEALTEIFNRTDEETVANVEEGLKTLKKNLFGFEVDEGKNDMVTGKISVNFAWSGDAVYAMDEAEADGVELSYSVPEEGSNIWFDGWCIPASAQEKELAKEFIEFLSLPEIAVRNMEYIGYTSVIAGDMPFSIEYCEYDKNDEPIPGSEYTVEYTGVLDWLTQYYELETEETEGCAAADLSYFFGKDAVLYTDTVGRQFSAQYPTEDIIDRCVVMHYFDDETNLRINEMWENVKGETLPVWAIVVIVAVVLLAVAAVLVYRFRDKIFKGKNGGSGKKKNLKVVEKKEV